MTFDYRYGFNGKEKDDEVTNQNGTVYDYGFRIYNPRLGKFLSMDPLSGAYPWYTPYQFAGNTPIAAIDVDGLEEYIVIHYKRNSELRGVQVIFIPYDFYVKEISYAKRDQLMERIANNEAAIKDIESTKKWEKDLWVKDAHRVPRYRTISSSVSCV